MPRYAIGIDLGTTNCALAWVDLQRAARRATPTVETFPITQWVAPGDVGAGPLLPSCLFAPVESEATAGAHGLPWGDCSGWIVGTAARKEGAVVPSRLVTSAKSWLCHPGVDRRAPILPWHADETTPRLSPVEASALLLAHLRAAWNASPAGSAPDGRLEDQQVVLTVPASFDGVARDLTVEAARRAGIERPVLIEEPQAAFYHWLHDAQFQSEASESLRPGTTCLVIDCGGGTTDFSLIQVAEEEGEIGYERLAVGDHLLLGGDNMDLALARHVEHQVSPHRRLDSTQWGSLVQNCRRVKEIMLGTDPPDALPVAVLGRGSKVVGGTLSLDLDRRIVRTICLDGFFPMVGPSDMPAESGRAGLAEFGLPYVADPAITRHLAAFLASVRGGSGADHAPDAILFNGGVFHAAAARERVGAVLASWREPGWRPTVLSTRSLDLAVARGAAAFGWARAIGACRVKSNAARSYYVGVEASGSAAAVVDEPAKETGRSPQTVVCVVPHGMEEGKTVRIDQLPLRLRLGTPVVFPLFTSAMRAADKVGELVRVQPGQLRQLPSVSTVLRGGRRAPSAPVEIELEATLTEIGTLELYCVSKDRSRRWKLQFQARLEGPKVAVEDNAAPEIGTDLGEEPPQSPRTNVVGDLWSEERIEPARALLRGAFDRSAARDAAESARRARSLVRAMEAALEAPRAQWPVLVLRSLWDTLLTVSSCRALSPEREERWYNLSGLVLRPGWGDAVDPFRVEQLWKVIHQGVAHAKSDAVWTEYWILCRRVAGGLDPNRQQQLSTRLLPYVQAAALGRKPPRRVGPSELVEIWRALASLELLSVSVKVTLGELLVASVGKKAAARHLWWSIGRLGARCPLHGPANVAVGPTVAERWIEQLLGVSLEDSGSDAERLFALALLARRTDDRARDVDADTRARVVDALVGKSAPAHWTQMVSEVTSLNVEEQGQILGDSLPPGLVLAGGTDDLA